VPWCVLRLFLLLSRRRAAYKGQFMAATPYQPPTVAVPSAAITQDDARTKGVTFRVVMLCIALAFLFGYMIPIIDLKLKNTFLGAAHLPPGAVAVLLFVLLVLNPLLKLLSRRASLSRNEILTIYISCLFSALVPGHGAESFFVGNLIGPFYFASAENKWLNFLNENLPSWFSPALQNGDYGTSGASYDAVNNWYSGVKDISTIPWGIWLTPLVLWGSLVLASYLMFTCLSVMLRAQWSEREALAFPLLRLPVDLTEDVDAEGRLGFFGRLLRNPLLWIGFGVAVFIQMLNGLHVYYPDVPAFPLEIAGNFFSEAPWNQIGWTPMKVLPIVVGITFLLTSEISFSLWFFYLLLKSQNIIGYYGGFASDTLPGAIGHTMGAKAFGSYQTVGAFFVYAAILTWTAREHLGHVARRAFGRVRAHPSEKDEALSYPVAFWGFLLSFAFLVGWCVFAGINPILAIALWVMYLVITISLARLIVEGGLLFVQQGWTPLGAMAQLFNSGPGTLLPASSIVPASFVSAAMMTDLRGFILPSFIQSFKLAHDHKIKMKPLLALIATVILITFVMGVYMRVRMGYENGAMSLNEWFARARIPAETSAALINGVDTKALSSSNWVWMGIGGGLTFLMMVARSRFMWFPLHPLGYLMSLSYPMYALWFSIFLGWLAKVVITKFGGSDTYRKTVPMFLGLALGDVVMMITWLIVDGIMGHTGRQLMIS
jgi:hypothetical protein